MDKDFEHWETLKQHLHDDFIPPQFNQGEIWWCSIGLNVGYEEDGKNDLYSRPVLIVRKFNRRIFLGIPLTTQIKSHRLYFPIHFKEQEQCVMLSQMRLWDSQRLTRKMGKLPKQQFEAVRKAVKEMI